MNKRTMLIFSQVYVPDPASVGQHMHDAAAEMLRRGFRVIVYASSRGYDDPTISYPRRETRDGVEIRRLPFTSFGKSSIFIRLIAGFSFVLQCSLRGMLVPRLAGILVSTSPPVCPLAAVFLGMVRHRPVVYWLMDLNPDQTVVLGKMSERSVVVRLFEWMNRLILRRAAGIVTLDRFMADRVNRKVDIREKMAVMPPWPHEDELESISHENNPFRKQHGLEGKFVIMYSGNHSLASPLKTVLEAALLLQDDPDLVFMFVGGGLGKKEVDEAIQRHQPNNIRSLPYQPLDRIRYSLSAADVHLVAVGPLMVGIVHPCKVYGAMAVGRPILLLGPSPCHVSDIAAENEIGWQIDYDDVSGAETVIRSIRTTDKTVLNEMGQRARNLVADRYSKEKLLKQFCDTLERHVLPGRDRPDSQ
jgi:glycosyltransferase involved in cell wall biosynthesis